ncbi:NADPH-dependent F420 reductase [Arthrobacter monumenti]
MTGKTVIDVMNYWAPTDGEVDGFENEHRTSSEIIQDFLAGSAVIKTLNHIGYHELEEDDQVRGTPGRRALALAGDHEQSKRLVESFIDRLGYDPVDAGPLAAGRAFQPGTEIFNGTHTAEQLHELLNAAIHPTYA